MKELFQNYSISDILVFAVIVTLAIKEIVSIIDWGRDRIKQMVNKNYREKKESDKIKKDIEELNRFYGEIERIDGNFANINKVIEKITNKIEMLIESDKESTKAYITEKHHYFVYDNGWIDNYSLECLEKKFSIYQREHGNSFVEGLMNEIRELPKCPPSDVEHRYAGTAEYIKKINNSQ